MSELEETCRGLCERCPGFFGEPFAFPGAGEAELLAANALRGTRPLSVGAKVLAASIEEIGELAAGAAVVATRCIIV